MASSKKKALAIAAIAAIALFGFAGAAKADEGGDDDDDDDELPPCPPGQIRDANGQCVTITVIDPTALPCPPGQVRNADGVCVDADVGPPSPDPDDIFSPTPQTGRVYQIKNGDNLTAIVRSALGLPQGSGSILPAIKCVYRTGYNLALYSARVDAGKYGAVFVNNRWHDASPSFYPRNANARVSIAQGNLPPRTVTPNGNKIQGVDASSYGSLYIPEMQTIEGGLLCPGDSDDPWDPLRNPSEAWLSSIGTSLAQLRQIFESSG